MAKYCRILINCVGGYNVKLSYIVPVYNVEKYLRECVDSILAQTFDDYEIILVDDASPDGCPRICDEYAEKYPNTVKVIHQENGGPAKARNVGLKIAEGKYVWFVDSDDVLHSDGVSRAYEKAIKTDADILHMSYLSFVDEKNNFTKTGTILECDKIFGHREMTKYVCTSNTDRTVIFAWRNIYKRNFLIENGVFFDISLHMLEDPPFNTLAFLKAERVVAADEPIYAYRIRNDSLQRTKYVKDYDLIMNLQWKLKLKYFSENSDNDPLFYSDIAEFTIKTNLLILLGNVYYNDIGNKFSLLKRIGNSDMIRKSFDDYDINKFKSKSLDWWATLFIRKKMYLFAHIICKYILYK